MNHSEAVRLLDLGHTEVTATDDAGNETRGVAVRLEAVTVVTIRRADGTEATVPIEQVERVR